MAVRVRFHENQAKIFLKDVKKYNVIAKGRRFGLTYGMMMDLFLRIVNSDAKKFLWGDTITGNILRYYKQFLQPLLKQARMDGLLSYNFNETQKYLEIEINGDAKIVDFRSADRPANWEGFGYDVVYLNEAGIILKNRYIWENAVQPMLLDNPDSIAFIGGAPKGLNLFYELFEKAKKDKTGRWRALRFTSYDNPFLDKKEIDAMVESLPPEVARQEIFAEFVSGLESYFFPIDLIQRCIETDKIPSYFPVIWGLDVGRSQNKSVLAVREGRNITFEVIEHSSDLRELVEIVVYKYSTAQKKPFKIFVDVAGMGWGVYDFLKGSIPVYPANVSLKSGNPTMVNKRAEMYWNLRQAMYEGLNLPNDPQMIRELSAITWDTSSGKLQIDPKKKIVQELGHSPDIADAIALTFFEENIAKTQENDYDMFNDNSYDSAL